jgi:tetratricopeptide (TPR) repeat protein
MHSLSQRCIAIVLLSSLLLQSCGGGRYAGTLRMTGCEEQESTDEKSPTQSRGSHGALVMPAASVSLMPAPGQADAPPVSTIAPLNSITSKSLTGPSATLTIDDCNPGALPQPPASSTASVMALSPVSSVIPASESRRLTAVAREQESIAKLKEAVEEGHGLILSQAGAAVDKAVAEKLFTDLEYLLQEERLCAPVAGEENAQEYITRLREDSGITWEATHKSRLTELLAQAFAQKLNRLVSDHSLRATPEGMRDVAIVLNQLAALYQEQGDTTGKLSHYTDAAVCYQHTLRIGEEETSSYTAEIEVAYEGLARIRASMIEKAQRKTASSNVLTSEALRAAIARDKGELETLRQNAKDRLAEIDAVEQDEAKYIEKSKVLFADIAERVGKFLKRLYEESEEELGKSPCRYTVVGLGSMALQQTTPYSDLEFAILMEDGKDEETLEAHRAYLRNLTHLVHLRVINLGETVVPRSKYDVSLDHLSKRGINFDLGGKTPLGRPDKKYDLIQPVAGMMGYLKNDQGKIAGIDKLLPFMLERTCYLHGDKDLHEAYEQASEVYLMEDGRTQEGVPVYQGRAREKLLPVLESPDTGLAKSHQRGDLATFTPTFSSSDSSRLYDVKEEIYRLPDRLLYGLAMYCGILPKNGWDAVDQLCAKKVIDEAAVPHLQYTVSFATLLRLRTYLYYGQQKEHMGVMRGTIHEEVRASFHLPTAALQEGGSLFKHYYTALPLYQKMKEFFNSKQKDTASGTAAMRFFKGESFYDDNDILKGVIYMRLMQYQKTIQCYEQAIERYKEILGEQPHPYLAGSLHDVGAAYYELGDPHKGLGYLEKALEMGQRLYGEQDHPDLASSLNNIGLAHGMLGDPHKGLEYLEKALEMRQKLYGEQDHPDIAASLSNVGAAYHRLGDTRKGLKCFANALEIRQKLYGNQAHPDLASSLDSVGAVHYDLGDTRKGLKCFVNALEMRQKLYEDQAHPDIAASLSNVGLVYKTLRDPRQGLGYLEKALEMQQKLYGNQAHPDIAASLSNVGLVYKTLGDPRQGLGYLEKALEMRQKLYGNQAHPDIVASLNNMGAAYKTLGNSRKGLRYLEKALEMRQKLCGNQAHPDIAASLSNMGAAYKMLGNPRKRLRYLEKALEMKQKLYGEQDHPDLATSLSSVGAAYCELGDPHKGLEYLEKALEMQQKLYGNQAHPDLATSLYGVGTVYHELEDPRQGLEYLEKALEMRQKLYGEQAHPDLATSLYGVGTVYHELGEYDKARQCYEEGLEISEKLDAERARYVQLFTQKLEGLPRRQQISPI